MKTCADMSIIFHTAPFEVFIEFANQNPAFTTEPQRTAEV